MVMEDKMEERKFEENGMEERKGAKNGKRG